MSNDVVKLNSRKDIRPLVEIFRSETESGPVKFAFTGFIFVDSDYFAYAGTLPIRKKEITLEQFKDNLKLIPNEEIYPTAPSNLTIAPPQVDKSIFYIKSPKLSDYYSLKGRDWLAKLLSKEVETMEFLKSHPHPNIVRYHGCIVKRDRIIGRVLDRYPKTLLQRLKMGTKNINVNECFEAISSAVSHMHSLGYAHNDICPMNIIISDNNSPFLIDFGSYLPIGSKLMTAGSPGWMEDDFETSEISHDEFSLGKLKSWLVNPIDSGEMKYPEV